MKKNILKTALIIFTAVNMHAQNSGINLANMDKSVNPCDDFYTFCNGTWLKKTQIPAQESMWGSFDELADYNNNNLKKILEECAADKNAKPGSNQQKIGDFYRIAMDTVKLEKEGFSPMLSNIESINKITNTKDLLKIVADFHTKGINSFFSFSVGADMKNSNANAVYFGQAELGLPDKMYYTDAEYANIRNAYKTHIIKMFSLLGDNMELAQKNAKLIFGLESKLADASMGRIELRDPDLQYNKFTKNEFLKKQTNINFNLYLTSALIVKPFTEVIITQPLYFDKLNQLITSISIADWKTYLQWCLINKYAYYLSDAFVKESFSFYGTTMEGAKEIKPRWKRMSAAIDGSIGEAIGQLYVEKYFDAESKKKVNEMVTNLFTAFKDRIQTRTWMSDITKQKALEKLSTIIRKLGYPDKWKDYSTLEIKNDTYVANIFRAEHFAFTEMINKIDRPVDKTEWDMTPPTVNAYYNPSYNEIVFPAGIMQAPFFNAKVDDAANYGIMGAIIGHELTHGFDDEGAKFDATGNLKDWWTAADLKNFEARTEIVRQQFDSYVAIDTLHVNGLLTLGENIADLGGLTMSYYAYKISLKGKASQVIDGFTGEQRFFIAWAQGWKSLSRPEALKQLIATNPHSPENFRGNSPVSNMKEFYDAFNMKETNKMYRPANKRAEVW